MPIPRPPSPPTFSLPMPDPDDFSSQPPLCTPVDLILNSKDNMSPSPPSPIRTTAKRRRTSALTVFAAANAFDDPPVSAFRFENTLSQGNLTTLPKGPHLQPAYPSLRANEDESTRFNCPSASQRVDLPEMSQDTLALFPTIVQEHHMMIRPPHINTDSQQSLDILPIAHPAHNRRRWDPARGQLAKASLFNTLSKASAMENPFLNPLIPPTTVAPAVAPAVTPAVTPHVDKSQFAIRKVPNASESFQNMGPVLDLDDNCPPPQQVANEASAMALANSASKSRAASKKEEKINNMKFLLVSSTQGRKLRIDFKVVRVAGKGAFSEVLQAMHRLDGCTYAIKKNRNPLQSDMARLEYLQEVFALSALQGHPNILRYHDAWFEDKGKVLMMQTEFLPEGSLFSHYIEEERAMPLQELFALAADISSALAFMHSKGIAHLDVKPDNIFRSNRALARESFIIGDFGLACHQDGTDARSTEGDSRYLCPEALGGTFLPDTESASEDDLPPSNGEQDSLDAGNSSKKRNGARVTFFDLRPRDIFSLGATLYELAMGSPLEKSGPEWHRIRSNTKRAAKEAGAKCGSAELANIIKVCLEPDPEQRASASEVMEICKAHDTPDNSRHVENLRKERDAARRQCKRYETVTSSLLKNGEMNRQRFRENCANRSKLTVSHLECR